jgi:hypothetical protein
MAKVDHSRVEHELKTLLSVSQGVRKKLRSILLALERNPGAFEELEHVPLDMASYSGVVFRKAKVIQGKHDYRIVFLHRQLNDGSEHVDLLYIFKRKEGYQIDWK